MHVPVSGADEARPPLSEVPDLVIWSQYAVRTSGIWRLKRWLVPASQSWLRLNTLVTESYALGCFNAQRFIFHELYWSVEFWYLRAPHVLLSSS